MRLAVIAAVVALAVGLLVGYLMWGRPADMASREVEGMRLQQAQQADEIRRLQQALEAEREQRQRLEEVVSRGRK
jgi:sensor histidine kinase regulating citrate/malate metabolism